MPHALIEKVPVSPPLRKRPPRAFFLMIVAMIVALAAWLERPYATAVFGTHGSRVFFAGPDDYMRAYRARQIASGAAWRIKRIPEINAPLGAELHWTAPMDYLLAGAYLVFNRFIERPDPSSIVAAFLPPALGVLYLLTFLAIMRRAFGSGPAILAGLLTALSISFHRVFRLGHPDHHCLLEILLLIAVGAWLPRVGARARMERPSRRAAIVAGLAMGAAIWVAAQAIFVWFAVIAGLTWACCFGPLNDRRAYAKARLVWNCALVPVAAAGYLIENWPDLYAVAIDKISLLQLVIVALGFLAPSRVGPTATESNARSAPAGASSQVTRFVAFLAALAALTVWIAANWGRASEYVSRPEFFRWSEQVMELRPMYVRAGADWSLRPLHNLLGYLPYALPALLVFFLRSPRVPRASKCTFAILAALVTLMSIRQLRWVDHFNTAVVPVAVVGVWELSALIFRGRRKNTAGAAGVRTAAMQAASGALSAAFLALCVFPGVRTTFAFDEEKARQSVVFQQRTDFVARQIVKYEAAHPPTDPGRRAILCEDGEGPLLLYWTGLPVVATPYHRALDGLVEAARFFAERDPAAARAQLDRLGVRYVALPARAHEQLSQFEEIAFGELRSFDPPESMPIGEDGEVVQRLRYRREKVMQTMAYRLVMEIDEPAIPGAELIAEINEGATDRDSQPIKTGLLYVVGEVSQPENRVTQPTALRGSDLR